MNNLNVNINVNDVLVQNEQETVVKKTFNTFNVKNYLQARLGDRETSKTLVIRLLPFSPEGGVPFQKVHMHQVRVAKDVSPSGWKTFVCPIHNKMGDACPFCSTAEQARKLKNEAIDKLDKEKFNAIEFLNREKEMWIVRCIERGHEEDGVKFWLFSHSKKNDGVYNKIINIFQRRLDTAKLSGKVSNIFDLNEGKDLLITLTKDSNNKTVINIVDNDEKTPLCEDSAQALEWVNDDKKWSDVYTLKSYDYMSIIIEGGVPVFDKVQNKYVDKETLYAETEANKIADIEQNITHQTKDFSVTEIVVNSNSDNADDLPF